MPHLSDSVRKLAMAAVAIGVAGLTACAASQPPARFTLTPPVNSTLLPPVQAARVLVQVSPVRVPDVLDRADVQVLSGTDQVVDLPHAMWRGTLAEEMQAGVLASLLGDGRIAHSPAPGYALGGSAPAYAVHLAVDRMDMALGQYARLDVTWSVQQHMVRDAKGHLPAPVVCRASWQRPVAGSHVADAVSVQQQLVQEWGKRMQRQLLAMAGQGQGTDACGG